MVDYDSEQQLKVEKSVVNKKYSPQPLLVEEDVKQDQLKKMKKVITTKKW